MVPFKRYHQSKDDTIQTLSSSFLHSLKQVLSQFGESSHYGYRQVLSGLAKCSSELLLSNLIKQLGTKERSILVRSTVGEQQETMIRAVCAVPGGELVADQLFGGTI